MDRRRINLNEKIRIEKGNCDIIMIKSNRKIRIKYFLKYSYTVRNVRKFTNFYILIMDEKVLVLCEK